MVATYLVDFQRLTAIDDSEKSVYDALTEVLDLWNEDEHAPQLFAFVDIDGTILAVVFRDFSDHEVAHVTYCDGAARSYRCHYAATEPGGRILTEISGLPPMLQRRVVPSLSNVKEVPS